jgi:TetR/AcrR family transcriptional regulator, regulator of autoinduction and epiphytic fitness
VANRGEEPALTAGGQARTRLARRAVTEAARELFGERGYASTTIDAISGRSGVPSATVYRLFSSKLTLLKTLFDATIAGDADATELAAQPHVQALLADPDPRKLLTGFAGIATGILSRGASVYPILASAAGSDPQAADLLAGYTRQREQGQGMIARSLASTGALRPGAGERDAADIIHALASPEVYRLLVADRGWPAPRYQEWLATTLISQLLGELPTRRKKKMTDNSEASHATTMTGQGVANRIVRGLLRTPGLNRAVGGRLVTLYVVGRKSGRQYTVPVAYTRQGGDLLIGTPFGWGRNLRSGEPVEVLLKGRRRLADVEAFTDEPGVTRMYAIMCKDNKAFANFNKVRVGGDGEPSPDDLHRAWADGARAFRLSPR